MALPQPFQVAVHPFPSATPYSCAYERGDAECRNALVYIPGLTGGPHTSPALVDAMLQAFNRASTSGRFAIWEFRMRSSYTGFGYSSLANDVEDIAALVTYLKSRDKKKIVLMGSSTELGCQACMEYMKVFPHSSTATAVDAYILQAPTSDRETAGMMMHPDFYKLTLEYANNEVARGNGGTIMPRDLLPAIAIFDSPMTAYRWRSLIAKGGDDDYFSSDLDDATLLETFGRINKPTLILPSENDEMIPPTVDKQALLLRWVQASSARTSHGLVSPLSELVPGADHALTAEKSQQWVAARVLAWLCP